MSSTPQEFKHESVQDPQSVVRYLNALSEGLQNGRLQFKAGETEMVVEPNGLIKFSIKAKREGKRIRITTRLSWKVRGDDNDPAVDPHVRPLVIESHEPQK